MNQNGKLVQAWTDLDTTNMSETELYASLFIDNTSTKWRIKPDIALVCYKLALVKNKDNYNYSIITVNSYTEEDELESNPQFVRWLHDWTPYRVYEYKAS